MGGSAQWAAQLPDLKGRFDVIALDLPGFGQNAHLPVIAEIEGFADWVIAELRNRGVDRYHLLGHSMGGMIVQEIIRKDAGSVDKLVLYGTGATGILPGRFETIEESKRRAKSDGPRKTARRISATWFLDEVRAPAYEGCAEIAERSAPEAISAGLDAMQSWSGSDNLTAIKTKTLVMWGDGDRTYSWPQTQQLWHSIPDARLAVVPNCAHAVHLEKPAIFNSLLLDFLG